MGYNFSKQITNKVRKSNLSGQFKSQIGVFKHSLVGHLSCTHLDLAFSPLGDHWKQLYYSKGGKDTECQSTAVVIIFHDTKG